jgi:hypothetical protein
MAVERGAELVRRRTESRLVHGRIRRLRFVHRLEDILSLQEPVRGYWNSDLTLVQLCCSVSTLKR